LTIHNDLGIKTVEEEAAILYKRFYNKLENHENPLKRLTYSVTSWKFPSQAEKKMV